MAKKAKNQVIDFPEVQIYPSSAMIEVHIRNLLRFFGEQEVLTILERISDDSEEFRIRISRIEKEEEAS